MPSLWFVVPVHGRLPLASICLKQLARTCQELERHGVLHATAVVVGDRSNLSELRRRTGGLVAIPNAAPGRFGAVIRDNRFLSRKFNDGIQLACDPQFNRRPADFVVPFGSDDWVDHAVFAELPGPNEVIGFQHMSFVREDGEEIAASFVNYPGGCGIRIYPRQLMARVGYRPADEDRVRACDASILVNLTKARPALRIVHRETDPRQIVDWKSHGQQITSYDCVNRWKHGGTQSPWDALSGVFPDQSLDEMRAHYKRSSLVAA